MPDIHTAAAAYADEETVDTDFVHHLVRGSELLQAGEPEAARQMLEQALRRSPKNQRGQSLLAVSYFKLGLLDRAEELYAALIADHPADPSLRVNLGLAQLKGGRAEDAARSFLAALDLAPSHRKAQGYLGLAHMQLGDFQSARECFERAGNRAMAERMGRALEREPLREVAAGGLEVLERDAPFSAAEPSLSPPTGGWIATTPLEPPDIPTPGISRRTMEVTSIDATRAFPGLVEQPFLVTPSLVMVEVQRELLCRLDGLMAAIGQVTFRPEFKRFRGRVTEKPFGERAGRMMRASGTGRLWIGTRGRVFSALEVGEDPAYFREEVLFGFEETLLFENGRMPSKLSGDLHLVHLRGHGYALVQSRGAPKSLEISPEDPVRIPLESLLGWYGTVTPRVVPLLDAALNEGVPAYAVELSGRGRALLDVPA